VIEKEKTALIAWVTANTNAPSEIELTAQNPDSIDGRLGKPVHALITTKQRPMH